MLLSSSLPETQIYTSYQIILEAYQMLIEFQKQKGLSYYQKSKFVGSLLAWAFAEEEKKVRWKI